jgi:hypothetical protein
MKNIIKVNLLAPYGHHHALLEVVNKTVCLAEEGKDGRKVRMSSLSRAIKMAASSA